MNSNIRTKFISREDILKSKCFNVCNILNVIENVLIDYKNKNVLLPDKISQVFDEESQNRINCMPATLLKQKISGVKWVSVFPNNPSVYNIPNITGVIILSELEKGFPIAVMDGTFCTAVRTAVMGAIGAKYLAKKDAEKISFIGSGEQAKMHFIAIKHVLPSLKICRVASKTEESVEHFINELSTLYPEMKFESYGTDTHNVPKGSDIIVTATSTQAPLLKADSISDGALYIHVGGWEDEYKVPLKANKIVCDNWETVKHRTQTISRMFKEKQLNDSNIYANIADIIVGEKKGREADEEFIYYNTVGLSFIDVAVAYYFYNKVIEADLGTDMILQEDLNLYDYLVK